MEKPFKDIIIESIEQNGTDMKKLSEDSRVPQRYLELILRGENSYLPAAPYVHGYIIRIAESLELDGDLLWELYKKENHVKISGSQDKLPSNRFSIETTSNKKFFIIGGLAVLVLLYITFRFNDLFGRPPLTVLDPNQESITVSSNTYNIVGSTKEDIKITINGELITLGENNDFQKEVLLEPGINTFTIKSSKFLGGESEVVRQIIRSENQEPKNTLTEPESTPTEETMNEINQEELPLEQ